MMSKPPSTFAMERAMSELLAARERLLAIDESIQDDDKLFADLLDGETTDAFDVIDRFVAASQEAMAHAEVCRQRAAALTVRAVRLEARSKAYRGMVLDAMQTLGMQKLVRPTYSASVRPGAPSVIVTDETKLSDAYVRVVRTPDKTAIGAALKAGDTVEGAEQKNAEPFITIRI